MAHRTYCVLRLHEPLTRVNWGGRATSLATARIIERDADRRIVSTINAPYILEPLSPLDTETSNGSSFAVVDELAAAIAARDPATQKLRDVHQAIAAADELVVNGEGDFILTERRSLVRTLAMMRAAMLMGKPVHLLNCILSHAPDRPAHERLIIEQVGETLRRCDSVLYRDPASLALHRELYGSVEADWAPDALFAWSDATRTSLADRQAFAPETEGLQMPVQRILASDQPYVVLSGTSRKGVDHDDFRTTVLALRAALRSHGIATIFAGSDGRDRGLIRVLEGSGLPVVDPRVPLTAAARLLWNAAGMVSGRYHPSILASLGGTPFVLMHSSSHKTRSLYDVVEHGGPADEFPFFSGGEPMAEKIAAALLSAIDVRGTRSRIRRSAAANGRTVTSVFTRVLRRSGVAAARAF